jgi:guanylate kinase
LASSTAEKRSRPVFVLTGTSGEGKSTLAKLLVERLPDELELAVSATTRPVRAGEQDGRDYWFLSDEEFDRRLEQGDFLEWVELPWGDGRRSGTLWSELDRIVAEGRSPVLEIETGGEIDERLDIAERQLALAPEFDHTIVNDDRERAVTELEGIVRKALDGAGTMPAHDPSPH